MRAPGIGERTRILGVSMRESIHFLGVLRRQLCLLATTEFWIPPLKSSAEFVIEDLRARL
jgi:hypothetical protein